MAKHQPAGAFSSNALSKAPNAETHPLAPRASEVTNASSPKLPQFSARIDPELLRRVKIEVATRGTTLQAATAEAFRLWLATT
jgi:hypothetical protein